METTDNSGTLKFSNPVSTDRDPIPGYESIVTLMFSAFSHGVGVMGDDSFSNWFNRNNMRASIEVAFSDLLKENQQLKSLNAELLEALEGVLFVTSRPNQECQRIEDARQIAIQAINKAKS